MVSILKKDQLYHIKLLLSNICEEHELVIGIFYKFIRLENKQEYMTCEDQPYHIHSQDTKLSDFFNLSTKTKYQKGKDIIGRVWASEDYEWTDNVQHLSSEVYSRKAMAKTHNLQSCLAIAYIEDDEIIGVMEYYLQEEWILIPELIEKIKYYLHNWAKTEKRKVTVGDLTNQQLPQRALFPKIPKDRKSEETFQLFEREALFPKE